MWGWNLNQLLGLFLESPCPLCQRSTPKEFCADCERQVQACRLAATQSWQAGELSVLAWGGYGGALKPAIAALKYHNQPQLARALGGLLADVWQTQNTAFRQAIVVPIPMHATKKQERGFDQAELLAKRFCEITRLPIQAGLIRIRATEAQFRLSSGVARLQNLEDAFAIAPTFLRSPPTQPVLLLDDIYTTGATALSAAQTLRRSGIRVCGIIVLARSTRMGS